MTSSTRHCGILPGYHLDYRPETYWPEDSTVNVLYTVNGDARRRFVRFCVANHDDAVLDEPLTEPVLSDEDTFNFASVSSEFYPELRPYYAEEAVKWLDELYLEVHRDREVRLLYPGASGTPVETTLSKLAQRDSRHDTLASS